jgi:hypothetical protein
MCNVTFFFFNRVLTDLKDEHFWPDRTTQETLAVHCLGPPQPSSCLTDFFWLQFFSDITLSALTVPAIMESFQGGPKNAESAYGSDELR